MIKGLKPLINDAEEKITEFEIWMTKEIDKERELPDDVPGDKYLNRMIKEEKCMICGRPAKEGSGEHEHIKSLLNRRTRSEVLKPEIQLLNNNIQRIKGFTHQLLAKHDRINDEIKNWRDQENKLITTKQVLNSQKKEIEDNIKKIEGKLGSSIDNQSSSISKVLDNMKEYEARISRLKFEIKQKSKDNARIKVDLTSLKNQFKKIFEEEGIEIIEEKQIEKVNNLIEAVEKTIEIEYNSLIKDIEGRANEYINKILSHNTSIKAKISIDPFENKIKIIDDNNQALDLLNTGHKTIIKMSVINSIISKSSEYKEQPFPFLTDAPTSSLVQKTPSLI